MNKEWCGFLHSYNIEEFGGFGKQSLQTEMFQCVKRSDWMAYLFHSYNIAQPSVEGKLS